MDTRIYVITHKLFKEPENPIYHTLHVGRALSKDLGYEGDDTNDSISKKNKNYCELTGMYWIWKNVTCDVVGLCHYRRYFMVYGEIIKENYIEKVLKDYDVIVPHSAQTNHKNNREHYANVHVAQDLEITREVLLEKYPEYEEAFDLFLNTNLASLGNMLITKKDIFDKYCQWLFDILFEVEKRVDISSYDEFQARIFGYLSERLFRIWLFMQPYKIKEEQVKMIETSIENPVEESNVETKKYKGRVIIMTGVYDTLDIFAYEFIRDFQNMGYEVMNFDSSDMQTSLAKLDTFIKEPVKAVITFNNLGFNMELTQGHNTWELLGIPCVNILMDHPYFHKKALDNAPANAVVLCPDKNHMRFIQRFYPNIPITGFLGHGGKPLNETIIPLKDRKIDVLYAGGISTPFIKQTMPDFSTFDFDAKAIGTECYNKLIAMPYKTFEDTLEETLSDNGIKLDDTALLDTIEKLRYVDMMIVTYYREKCLQVLAEAGVELTIYGTGWDECPWISRPNVHFMGRIGADEVVKKMLDSKIVLNTMTWFKDGTHDRVFNGMLAGALVATDSSVYMKEEFTEDELLMFELDELQDLPGKIKEMLGDLDRAQKIADDGREKAFKDHTWTARARELETDLISQL